MKLFLSTVLAFAALLLSALGAEVKTKFGSTSENPFDAIVIAEGVDFEATQSLDVYLPKNFRYKVQSVEAIVRTAPSAITTQAKLGISSYDGSTAAQLRGGVSLHATGVSQTDVLFSAHSQGSGYVYYQNIVAPGTTGLCTENVTLNTPGELAGEVSPDVPRKLVLTLVDNAGDDLAGTVTLTGLNVEGEEITETITVVAETVSYTTENVFATFTEGTHDFGETGTATDDTLNIGQGAAIGLPSKNAVPILVVSTGTVETPASTDPDQGALTFTDVPDGSSDYEVWYRTMGVDTTLDGGEFMRLAITGSTVTGSDIRDVVVRLLKY